MNLRLPLAVFGGFALIAAVPAMAQVPLEATGAMQSAPADSAAASTADTTPKKHKHKHQSQSSDSSASSDSMQPAPAPQ